MSNQEGLPSAPLRLCRVCGEEKDISAFRVGHAGRQKSICAECADALIAACLGPGGSRRCVDCKRLTADYRCRVCWKRIRGAVDASGADETYFSIGW
jgi:hypothetical protein